MQKLYHDPTSICKYSVLLCYFPEFNMVQKLKLISRLRSVGVKCELVFGLNKIRRASCVTSEMHSLKFNDICIF